MKTAVEWFANRVKHGVIGIEKFEELEEQAKEIDKERKIDMLHSIIHDAQMGKDVEDVEAWFKKYENKSNENSNN